MVHLSYAGRSDAGRQRENNEDAWFADAASGLFVVADGMGGERAGELAAEVVVTLLPRLVEEKLRGVDDLATQAAQQSFHDALAELSDQVRAETVGEPGLEGMGAAAAAVLIRGSRALVGHMGDSRVYVCSHGWLRQITRDHSIAQLLVDAGEISPDQAKGHPGAHQLSRYVGMPDAALPEVQSMRLQHDDIVLLCTDGLTGMLSDEQIAESVRWDVPLDETCSLLVASANDAGGEDNVTVVLVRLEAS